MSLFEEFAKYYELDPQVLSKVVHQVRDEMKAQQKLEMTFRVDADRWKQLAGVLVPGQACRITWHYANYDHWYLNRGDVRFHSNVWTGHLTSAPVRIEVAPAGEAASRPGPQRP